MILIDGYNLMHAAGLMKARFGPGGLEKARRALVGVLAGSLGPEHEAVTVVFDARGEPAKGHSELHSPAAHGVQIEFASGVEGADERIEQLIRLESAPKRLTVVSSDARIRAATRRRGGQAVESEEFWRDLVERRARPRQRSSAAPEKPAGHATGDRESWLKEYEGLISDDELRELAGPFGEES